MRALVDIEITKPGFDDLRADVFCETRPQSLIGEYFVDCQAGGKGRELEPGATIPVAQTGTTVPVDLVNNIMRRPYRERFSILLSELGAALAARGDDLNETIRRAVPALRETDRVLAMLAASSARSATSTTTPTRSSRRSPTSATTSRASSTRPRHGETSASRARGAARAVPAAARLPARAAPDAAASGSAAATRRRRCARSPPSAPTSALLRHARPLRRGLAARDAHARRRRAQGRPRSRPRARGRRLARGAKPLPEIATNLAITLSPSTTPSARSRRTRAPARRQRLHRPRGDPALLLRPVQATNVFDAEGHLLKVSAFLDAPCAHYADAEAAKAASRDKCRAPRAQPAGHQPARPDDDHARRRRSARRATARPSRRRRSSPSAGDHDAGARRGDTCRAEDADGDGAGRARGHPRHAAADHRRQRQAAARRPAARQRQGLRLLAAERQGLLDFLLGGGRR